MYFNLPDKTLIKIKLKKVKLIAIRGKYSFINRNKTIPNTIINVVIMIIQTKSKKPRFNLK